MQQATTPPQPYRQTYSPQPTIEGVQEKVLKHMAADEGDFAELFRLTERGTLELFPEFQLRQINRTRNFPNSIKAWHLHERQDEIWYVPPYHQLTMGLWDVRPNSPTYGLKYKRV
jgi:dTDP-4-dehydrorhamnose 3,5-epimerase